MAQITTVLAIAVLLPIHSMIVGGRAARRFLTTGKFRREYTGIEVYGEIIAEPF